MRMITLHVPLQTKLAAQLMAKPQGIGLATLVREWIEEDLSIPPREKDTPRIGEQRKSFSMELDPEDLVHVIAVSKRTRRTISKTIEMMVDELLIAERDPLSAVREHFPPTGPNGNIRPAVNPSIVRQIRGDLPPSQKRAIEELTDTATGVHQVTILRAAIRRHRGRRGIRELPRKIPSVTITVHIRERTLQAVRERAANFGVPAAEVLRDVISARTAAREEMIPLTAFLPALSETRQIVGNDALVGWVNRLGRQHGAASELASASLHNYLRRIEGTEAYGLVDFHRTNQGRTKSVYLDPGANSVLMDAAESEGRAPVRVMLAAVGLEVQHRLAHQGLSASPIEVSGIWSDGLSI